MSFRDHRTPFGLITRILLAIFLSLVAITAIGLVLAGFLLSETDAGVILAAIGITVLMMILAIWAWFPGPVLWP